MIKRVILISILSFIYVIVECINWICLALDNIFFPAWKKTVVRAPVFIIGMPRTGTTWLQSVLSADQHQFSSMKLWEILFAPSVIQKRFFLWLSGTDKHFHQVLTNQLRKLDRLAFSKYNPMHPTSFFDFGEDDLLLIHIFSGLFLIFLFPWKRNLNSIIRFDDFPDPKRNNRMISFYKKCIQRHMLVFGAQKTYLSKGPGHTPKMRYLNFFFPDCRFICTTRPPEQVIPSAISLFVRFCEVYHTPYHTGDLIERTIAMADYWYPHPLDVFKDMEENRQVVIQYRTMIHTISQSVSAIYKKLGLVVSKDFYVFLLNQEAQQYQSNHKYSAEKYGLNANEISIRYKSSYVGLLEKSVHGN